MIGEGTDHVTVLGSVDRKFATKRFRLEKGEIKNRSYGSEKYFTVATVAVSNIVELANILETHSCNQYAFIIRGEPLPGVNRKRAPRRLHPNKKTGEPATFEEVLRHWLMVDVDHIHRPITIDPVSDPEGAIEYVIGLLPPELHDAWCWWQFSSSQSLDPKDETLSTHLWVWSEVALDNAACKRWAIAANQHAGYKLIDPAPFNAVQPHYIAPPIFANGLKDPLPRRCGLRQGLDEAVSLIIPEPAPKRPNQPSADGWEPGRGVAAWLAEIGGRDGSRGPLRSAICSYFAIYGTAADPEPIKKAIRKALDRIPAERQIPHLQELYASDAHLDAIIDWVRNVHGERPGKQQIPGPPPDWDQVPPAEEEPGRPGAQPGATFRDGKPAPFSDEALALDFSATHHAQLRYVAPWGTWLMWAASFWNIENTLRAFDLARALCRAASADLMALDQAKTAGDVAAAKTVAAVERLARADRRHAATTQQWDSIKTIMHHPEE